MDGTDGPRRRARDLGLAFGSYPPGPHGAITDVAGVRVGHTTLVEGDTIRTGVTAIVPDAVDRAGGALAAGLFVGNGYGKLIGATQLVELGVIETPIVLTGTLSAFRAADALVTYMLRLPGNEQMISVNPVVGETNDGYLSDIRARPVTEQHVLAAISGAVRRPGRPGRVGAGTGTAALGFKAGIGTASRVLTLADGGTCTVGVLVQANFSGTLTVRGVRIDPAGDARGRPAASIRRELLHDRRRDRPRPRLAPADEGRAPGGVRDGQDRRGLRPGQRRLRHRLRHRGRGRACPMRRLTRSSPRCRTPSRRRS